MIWRYFYLTWTMAQIAQDLHIPKGTVKSKMAFSHARTCDAGRGPVLLRRSLQEMGAGR